MGSGGPKTKAIVSESTHKVNDNGNSSAICHETEGNLVPQATTPQNESGVSIKSTLPPLVIDVPQLSPHRRDLSRISDLEKSFENGYDSDGLEGPFFDAVDAEGEQDFDKDSLHSTPPTPDIEEADGDAINNPGDTTQVVLTQEIVITMGEGAEGRTEEASIEGGWE